MRRFLRLWPVAAVVVVARWLTAGSRRSMRAVNDVERSRGGDPYGGCGV